MRTLALTICSLLVLGALGLGEVKDRKREEHAIGFAASTTNWVVPTSANNPGRFGAFFKTRVVIHNHTESSYPIVVLWFGPQGPAGQTVIPMEPNGYRVWDDFLGEALNYSGPAAVVLDSCASDEETCADYRFSVTAEVYTDSPNGRFKTMVVNGTSPFPSLKIPQIPGLNPLVAGFLSTLLVGPAFNAGISVNDEERTNVGVFNSAMAPCSIRANVTDSSGNLVEVVSFEMAPLSWDQEAIVGPVDNGLIRWEVPEEVEDAVFLWAVVVDNTSNDGSLFPAVGRLEL